MNAYLQRVQIRDGVSDAQTQRGLESCRSNHNPRRAAEADAILFPMLEGYGKSRFEGRDAKGRSPDWRRWDGTATGYEGYLTDNYYALLAVPLRQSETRWSGGFRPAAWPEITQHN